MHFFILLNGLLFSKSDFNGHSLKPNSKSLLWSIKWNLRSLFLNNSFLFRLNNPNNDLLFHLTDLHTYLLMTNVHYNKSPLLLTSFLCLTTTPFIRILNIQCFQPPENRTYSYFIIWTAHSRDCERISSSPSSKPINSSFVSMMITKLAV